MVAVGLVIAAGQVTPLFAVLFKTLPGLANFRVPARAGELVILGLIMGATIVADGRANDARLRRATLVAGGLVIAVLGWFFLRRMPAGTTGATAWLCWQLASVAVGLAAWWLWLGRRDDDQAASSGVRRQFLAAVIAVEIGTSILASSTSPASSRVPDEAVVAAAIHARGLDRQVAPVRVCLPATMMRENSGMIYRYATLTGFESLSLARTWTYLHRAAGADPNHAFNTSPMAGSTKTPAAWLGQPDHFASRHRERARDRPRARSAAYLVTRFTAVPDAQAAMT